MSRVRYREPSIDRHCGSEPGDVADALAKLGLVALDEDRLSALDLGRAEAEVALEYAGIRWAREDTALEFNRSDTWAEPWVNDALKAARKHPHFRSNGAARRDPENIPIKVGSLLRHLVLAAVAEPGLIAALTTMKALTAVGGRGEAMAEMLMARRVWHRRWITTDPEAWAAAVQIATAP